MTPVSLMTMTKGGVAPLDTEPEAKLDKLKDVLRTLRHQNIGFVPVDIDFGDVNDPEFEVTFRFCTDSADYYEN